MCRLLVGLPDVRVIGVADWPGALVVHIEQDGRRPVCPACATTAWVKDRPEVVLVDLPVFGRACRTLWHKHRWCCPNPDCAVGSWTGEDPRIAAPRLAMTDRVGRWVAGQVGQRGRTVNEVARELGCDWHTINDTVIAYGSRLVDDPERLGAPIALGLDETLFVRVGPYRRQAWSTEPRGSSEGLGALFPSTVAPTIPSASSVATPVRWTIGRSDPKYARWRPVG